MEHTILEYSDKLHRVLVDKYAVERRCVPSNEVLGNALREFNLLRPNKAIEDLGDVDFLIIYKRIVAMHGYELNKSIPTNEETALIGSVFKQVACLNRCLKSVLDVGDLWVLCILYNIVCYEKDENAYMDKFKAWRG